MSVIPRPGIFDLPPYVAGASSIQGLDKVVKLGSNEAAFGPSPKAVDAYYAAAKNLHRYPDQDPTALREAIAARYRLDPARVVCGNGSSQLIHLIANIYSPPRSEVVVSAHAFVLYRIVTMGAGATPVLAPETDQLAVDVDAMLDAVTDKTRIVYLANPNNPTGTMLPASELERLWQSLPEHVLFVLDSAYADYIDEPNYVDGLEWVPAERGNLVVLRTFSKIYGLGGLRIGWAYAPGDIVDALNRYRPPFSLSAPAEAAAIAALSDDVNFEKEKSNVAALRPFVENAITEAGFRVTPGTANFTLIHFDDPDKSAENALQFMQSRGFILRPVAAYELANSLRLTIATKPEMDGAIAALRAFRDG